MKQQIKSSSMLSAGVVLVAALVAIVNYFGWKYYQRFDWTRSDLYSLSERSTNLMSSVERDIEATVFMSPEHPLYQPSVELLSRYEASSDRFSSRIVDPAKNPLEARALVDRFELSQVDVIVLESAGESRIIEAVDLADYDYSGLQFGQGPELTGFKGEQAISSAILALVEQETATVLFTVGHGELSLDELSARGLSEAADLLRQDNFDVSEWQSLGAASVPEETSLVVVAGPLSGFVEPELEVLRAYLEHGGRLLVLLDPVLDAAGSVDTGLEDFLAAYGVEVGADIVVDPSNPVPFFGAETIFVDAYDVHPITRSLDQAGIPVILPLARSVAAVADEAPFEVTELMTTTAEGWGERDLGELDRVERGENDLAGPVPVAVAVRRGPAAAGAEDASPEARMVVFGDADFASNGQLVNVGNTEMLLSAVSWLTEREELLGIPPKSPDRVRLTLTGEQLGTVAWLVFGILPGAAILAGVLVFLRRRR